MVIGDTHGGIKNIVPKLEKAHQHGIQKAIVVGDFGLWDHEFNGVQFLDEVNAAATQFNLSVFAIGGNHENWDRWEYYVKNNPTSKGFAYVRSCVLIAPKVHEWTWANKKFIGAGGAVSIDAEGRRMSERGDKRLWDNFGVRPRGRGPRTEWWDNEELTDQDVMKVQQLGTADYLFTHDCSNFTQFKNRLKPDAASERHRVRMDKVIKSVKPRFHFHGHMHEKFDWVNTLSHGDSAFLDSYDGPETRTLGLECDRDFNSWGILDTEQEAWYWPIEFEQEIIDRAKRKSEHDKARGAL